MFAASRSQFTSRPGPPWPPPWPPPPLAGGGTDGGTGGGMLAVTRGGDGNWSMQEARQDWRGSLGGGEGGGAMTKTKKQLGYVCCDNK